MRPQHFALVMMLMVLTVCMHASVDAALVLDRSESMEGNPLLQAKNAANQFVQLFNIDDEIAVVSFSNRSSTHFPMTRIVNLAQLSTVTSSINSIETWQYTSIGDGLYKGQWELVHADSMNTPQGIVLLSDGRENMWPLVAAVMPVLLPITQVYTIGYTTQCDQALLSAIANATGGFYSYASTADIPQVMNTIYTELNDEETLLRLHEETLSTSIRTYPVRVEGLTNRTDFNLMWHNPEVEMNFYLTAPDGTVITPQTAFSNDWIEFRSYPTQQVFRVTQPISGDWNIHIQTTSRRTLDDHYFLGVTSDASIEFDYTFLYEEENPSDEVGIKASLHALTALEHARLSGIAVHMNGDVIPFDLLAVNEPGLDQGHTRVFMGSFVPLSQGSYTVILSAEGSAETCGDFIRDSRKSIHIPDRGVLPADQQDAPEIEATTISAYPNPFNPTTTFHFSVPTDTHVRIDIYNVQGQRVRNLINGMKTAGNHQVVWKAEDENGRPLSSGVYFFKMHAGGVEKNGKVLLMK